MISLPVAFPLLFVLLLLLLAVFVIMVEIRVLAYAYRKIGIRPRYIFGIMLLTLLGSHVNIPLYSMPGPRGATVVAINMGGALIPILVSLYLFFRSGMYAQMLVGIAIVAAIVHQLATIVPGMGIAVPMLVPPLAAAGVSLLLAFRRAPPVAYVSGSMGALIGADLLNLGRIAELGVPVVSIGGAGTFDGVFLTGIIAGLLA